MIATFLLLAAQVLPAPGSITAWETLPEDPSGRNFLDPASIRRDGDSAQVIVRGVAHRGAVEGYHSLMMRFRIDCRARTLGIEAADGYDADGRMIRSREASPAEVVMAPVGDLPSMVQIVARTCRR